MSLGFVALIIALAGGILLYAVISTGIHKRSRLHTGANQRNDLIERRQHEGLLRNNPGSGQHFRIGNCRLNFQRVLVHPVISLDNVQLVGMGRHPAFCGHPCIIGEISGIDHEYITFPMTDRLSPV